MHIGLFGKGVIGEADKMRGAEEKGKIGMKAVATVVVNRVQVPYGEYARISQGRKY